MADWNTTVGLVPDYSFATTGSFVTLISKAEGGKERRRSKRSTLKREWKLTFPLLTVSECGSIWDFYLARKGAFEAFTWTDPVTSTQHTVRFKDDDLTKDYFEYNYYKLSLEFVEVI